MLYCPLPMSRLGDELHASSLASLCPRAWHIVGAGFAYLSHDRKLRSSWTGWRKAGLAEGWVIWESSPHCPAWLAASHTAAASGSMQMGRACLKVTAVPTPPASLWPSNLLSTFPGSLGLLSGGPVPAQSPRSPLSAPPNPAAAAGFSLHQGEAQAAPTPPPPAAALGPAQVLPPEGPQGGLFCKAW